MKALEGYKKLIKIKGKRISEIKDFKSKEAVINKGGFGQLIEKYIGLDNTSKHIDFIDGDLKTNKTNPIGIPMETIFITQIKSIIDEMLLSKKTTYQNRIFKKIKNLLYVGVCKEPRNNIQNWKITNVILINQKTSPLFYQQIEKDYFTICSKLKRHVNNTGMIHTSNGEYMQVRTKDSKPYKPIYSENLKTNISNKNFALYLMPRKFMKILID